MPPAAALWSARLVPGQRHLVLPDGCMDLVFRDGPAPELFWVGPMTRAEVVRLDAPAAYAGIRLAPGLAPGLAGHDARDLLDRDLPVEDGRLLEALVAARTAAARLALLRAAIARGRTAEADALVVRTAGAILASRGMVRITEMADRAGVSERTLHRRFLAAVGYGPKRLARVARLGSARELALRGVTGAALAAEAGYFDQAHLCHELASFGLSASDLAGRAA